MKLAARKFFGKNESPSPAGRQPVKHRREARPMNEDNTFMSFMRKVRTGDAIAAEELVRRYQSVIKSAVKRRLGTQTLRQRFDESDVCQSVLNSFFARYAAGQYDLDDPKQLAALLVAMAQNKFRQQARFQFRERRDVRVG